jgi:hypothetical protein
MQRIFLAIVVHSTKRRFECGARGREGNRESPMVRRCFNRQDKQTVPEGVAMKVKRLLLTVALLVVLCSTIGCGSPSNSTTTPPQNASKILTIASVAQELPEWCWLASGQMVFQFFGIPAANPNYQCGIIGVFYGPTSACFYNCGVCDAGAGSSANVTLMLEDYSYYASSGTQVLYSQFTPSQLPFQQVQHDIDSSTPVLAGINPSSSAVLFGQSQHLVVIVGYEIQNGQDYLVVNDPFPFAAAGYPDPYLNAGAQALQPGQYLVTYETFVQSLLWNTSFDGLVLGAPQSSDRQRLEPHFGAKTNWERKLDREEISGSTKLH